MYVMTSVLSVSTGFTGSDAKVEYIKKLGFDVAYNYTPRTYMS